MSLLELAGTSGLARTGQPNNQEQRRGRCHDTILQPGHAMTHTRLPRTTDPATRPCHVIGLRLRSSRTLTVAKQHLKPPRAEASGPWDRLDSRAGGGTVCGHARRPFRTGTNMVFVVPLGIGLRRCRFRLAVAQVRLSGEQVVQGCLHGVVVQVGVVEREVRGVCQASPSGGRGDVQTPRPTCRRAWAFTRASAAS